MRNMKISVQTNTNDSEMQVLIIAIPDQSHFRNIKNIALISELTVI